jgi:photosystem II stability/assembly factor-like uncharacterized protein
LGGDGFYIIVDYTDPNIIYAESQFGNLRKSTNGGASFFYALNGINSSEPTNWSTPVVMDPNNSNILYYGTNRIYKTTNGAQYWNAISGNLTDGNIGSRFGTVTTIAVAPSNSNVIYAGTDDSHVWVTSNAGLSWTDISGLLPYRWVTRVVVDPGSDSIVYVTFSGLKWKDPQPHVFRSTDMGKTWNNISANLPDAPVNAFAIDQNNHDILYLGSDVGAYVSFNSGLSWEPLGTGLPIVSIYDMKIHPVENYLAIGTHGRSMYKLDLDQFVGIEEENYFVLPVEYKLFQNYPNPFNPSTTIEFFIPKNDNVRIDIFNINGEKINTLIDQQMEAGNHSIVWKGENTSGEKISSGIYFINMRTKETTLTKKAILIK